MKRSKSTTVPSIPAQGKHIAYSRETRDYAAYLDGQLVGYFGSHGEATIELDRVVFERLSHAA